MTEVHHCITGGVLERQHESFEYEDCSANWSKQFLTIEVMFSINWLGNPEYLFL